MADHRDKNRRLSPFAQNIVAGAAAGTAEILAMYPLDVVKTRLQLQTTAVSKSLASNETVYVGVIDAFRKIIKQEGFNKLYRGIASPIVAEAPKRAVKFAMNEQYKSLMLLLNGGRPLRAPEFMASGALAGMTEAFVNCPFEVVKVRMQAKENLGLYKSTTDAAITTIKNEGITAIYKGLEPLLWRNGIWNGAYFGTIGYIKSLMPKGETRGKEQLYGFCAGVVGGTFATTLNTPFDVVKSRMQNTNVVGAAKWTLPTLGKIYREEGAKALFRGYVPRILRLGPGGGIMIVAFDFVNHILNSF